MCILDINKAYECLDKIEISSYDEYALKKASLLNQLNKKKEAKELITSTVAFVSQQRYSENRNASLIGYANLVARASWMIFDGQELFSDSLYEDNPFNCRKVVIKSKESIIETIFENQRPQNRRINSFNPNAYTINYTMGSTGESKKAKESLKYLLLQDLLCIGIYREHKNATDAAIKNMIAVGQAPKHSKVVILGLTFKENCPDTRNSKVDDIIKRLEEYEIKPLVVDPWASEADAMHEYDVKLTRLEDVKDADCVIVAVAHNEFKSMSLEQIRRLYRASDDSEKVLIDVKGIFKLSELQASGMKFWRL